MRPIALLALVISAMACAGPPDNVIAVYDGGSISRDEMQAFLQSGMRPKLRGDAAASEEEGLEQLTRFYAAEKILASEVEASQVDDPEPVLYLDTRARALVRFYIELVGKTSYEIPDEELLATYEELRDSRFTFPEKVKFQHVFLRSDRHSPEEARRLLSAIEQRLRDGASMDEMVAEHSESGTRDRDGIVGPVFRGKMDREFEEQVFARGGSEQPFVVEAANGYHLVRILHYSGPRVMDFEEARPQIVSMLVGERTSLDRELAFDRLGERYGVEVVEAWRLLADGEPAIRVGERTLTRAELQAYIDDHTRLSLRKDVFEPELEEELVRDLVQSNLMYLDAVDRGLADDAVFTANWGFRVMRTRAGVARQRRLERHGEALSDDEVLSAFEAEPHRYVAPPRREVSYVFVPFLDQDPFERLKLAEHLGEMLREQTDRDEITRHAEANEARFVELGVLVGHQSAGLGPDGQRALVAMEPHQVSDPIRVSGGVVVLAQGEVWERRALEMPADADLIRARHVDLHRSEFLGGLEERVLEEKGFRMLNTELFPDVQSQPTAQPSP